MDDHPSTPKSASGRLSPLPLRTGAFRFNSKLERRIVQRVGRAIFDFRLIEAGDHILLAVSGGKDSLSLLSVLDQLRRRSPIRFELTIVTVHQGSPHFKTDALETHYQTFDYPYRIVHVPIEAILKEKEMPHVIPCALCSRIRRGVLYTTASELNCNKIALGHHLDDALETLLLNLFYSGKLRAMAARYRSDNGHHVVIRPLCYVPESWLIDYSEAMAFPTTSCGTTGCGAEDTKRQRMKRLIAELDQEQEVSHISKKDTGAVSGGIRFQMLRALKNVHPRHLLDPRLLSAFSDSSEKERSGV